MASSLSVFWHLGSRAMPIHLTVLSLHFLVELLQECMLQWAQVVLNSHPDLSYVDFLSKFRSFFNCFHFTKIREVLQIDPLIFRFLQWKHDV